MELEIENLHSTLFDEVYKLNFIEIKRLIKLLGENFNPSYSKVLNNSTGRSRVKTNKEMSLLESCIKNKGSKDISLMLEVFNYLIFKGANYMPFKLNNGLISDIFNVSIQTRNNFIFDTLLKQNILEKLEEEKLEELFKSALSQQNVGMLLKLLESKVELKNLLFPIVMSRLKSKYKVRLLKEIINKDKHIDIEQKYSINKKYIYVDLIVKEMKIKIQENISLDLLACATIIGDVELTEKLLSFFNLSPVNNIIIDDKSYNILDVVNSAPKLSNFITLYEKSVIMNEVKGLEIKGKNKLKL